MKFASLFSPTSRGLANLYIPSLAMSFGQGMVIPAIPVFASEFNISVGLAAQVVTAYAIGRVVSLVPAGIMIDRMGSRFAMVLGPLMVAAGVGAIVVTPVFWVILAAQFVVGMGDSLWMLAREVTGINLVKPSQRGRVMSGFMGVTSAGMSLGPVVGGLILEEVGLRTVFVAYAAIASAVLLGSVMSRHSAARAPRPSHVKTSPFKFGRLSEIERALRPTYIALVAATFAMMLYRMVLQSMMPLYMDSQLGYSPVQVGSIFGISTIFIFAMIIPAGFITDKIGRKWATVPSTIIPALAFFAIPFANSMLELSIIASVLGMANGLSLGSVATSTFDVVPEHARARFQALRRVVGEMGGVAGPFFGGIIANAYNPGMTFLIFAPFILVPGLLLAIVAKETLVKNPPSEK
jgi:MFS family permease